jgi:hypothetical protein
VVGRCLTLQYVLTGALVLLFVGCGGDGRSVSRDESASRSTDASAPQRPSGTIVDKPSGLAGTEVVVRGSVYGLMVDPKGHRLGTSKARPDIELNEIPGGVFNQADGSGSFFVTRAARYRGSWTATADGEVQFVVRDYRHNAIEAAASTLPIAVHAGAALALAFSVPTQPGSPAVAVDESGNGSIDRTVRFGPPVRGAAASDLTPPVSHVTVGNFVDSTGRRMAKVTITAKDEPGGSGVARIEYALNATNTSGTYSSTLTIPARGKIIVRAIDRAGNIETPYQFVPLRH